MLQRKRVRSHDCRGAKEKHFVDEFSVNYCHVGRVALCGVVRTKRWSGDRWHRVCVGR